MSTFNVLPILFISFLLVTRQCLGASLKQSSPTYSTSDVLGALDRHVNIRLEQSIIIAFRKYQTKYFPKRQPYVNLQLVKFARDNYSKDEQNDTAKGALFRICKLLSVFRSSVYLAWYDEGHNGGSVAKTLKNLSFEINDTLNIAMYLAVKLHYGPLPSEIRVSRESMDNRVIQYKKSFKDNASVNSIRTWRTLYEMKYFLINELANQVKKLRSALSM